MKPEMRQKLAREPFAEKVRKVAQLIRLAKTFPRRPRLTPDRKSQLNLLEAENLKLRVAAEFVNKGSRLYAKG